MSGTKRFKLSAGAGLVTMLLGALMVLAPGAGATDLGPVPEDAVLLPAGGGRVPICHATSSHETPYVRNTPSFSATGGPSANHDSHDGPVYAGPQSEDWGDIIPPVAVNGHLVYAGSDNWDAGGSEMYAACSGAPEAPQLSIEKDVPGEDDDPTEFQFSVVQGQDTVEFEGPGDDKITESETLEAVVAPGQVVVTEAASAGYTLSAVSCVLEGAPEGEELDATVDLEEGTATFDALAGDVITCTFRNDRDSVSPTGSLRIDKVVAGTAAGSQPADRAFGFTAVCEDANEAPLSLPLDDATFTLTNLGAAKVIDELPAGAVCTIEETVRHSPNGGTTVKVGAANAAPGFKAEDVAVGADTITDVVFTNIYNTTETIVVEIPPPPAPASLRLNKAVEAAGDAEAPDTWEANFDVLGADVDESRRLDQDVTTTRFDDLAAGTYTITETAEEGSTLTEVDCVERNGADIGVEVLPTGVTVAMDAGENVVCTFTNTYAEVASGGEEPTPEPEPTPPEPTVEEPTEEVKGDVVTRPQTLPRTGNESKGLAGAGALLVALGAAMVLGSKRQLAQR